MMLDYIKSIETNIVVVCIISIFITGVMSYLTGEWYMLIGCLVTCFIVYFFTLGNLSSAEHYAKVREKEISEMFTKE